MDNMSEQWDKTHLCRRYNENDCEFFLQTDNTETVLDGHKLAKCCYYCTSENKVRKKGSGGTWTGFPPKFCPKRKTEKGKNENMSKRCQELLADNTAPEPQEDKFAETDKPKPTYKEYFNSANDNTDTETADKLRAVSEQVISIKATYVIETAKQVKAAHDLLANHYNGLFGAWCESVGFTRQTGNNLVHVAETFPDLTLSNAFDNISARLLYEASKPSAPKELVEQVKNGDITTHKDYIAMKKELDEANKTG